MTGQIVSVVLSNGTVTGAVRVNDGDGLGAREYVAAVPAADPQGTPYSKLDIMRLLIAAWQAQRAARPQPAQDLTAQFLGQVNL